MLLSKEDQVRLVRDVAEVAAAMRHVSEDLREIKEGVGKDVAALRADIEVLKKDRDKVKVAVGVASSLGGGLVAAVTWLWTHFGT